MSWFLSYKNNLEASQHRWETQICNLQIAAFRGRRSPKEHLRSSDGVCVVNSPPSPQSPIRLLVKGFSSGLG